MNTRESTGFSERKAYLFFCGYPIGVITEKGHGGFIKQNFGLIESYSYGTHKNTLTNLPVGFKDCEFPNR